MIRIAMIFWVPREWFRQSLSNIGESSFLLLQSSCPAWCLSLTNINTNSNDVARPKSNDSPIDWEDFLHMHLSISHVSCFLSDLGLKVTLYMGSTYSMWAFGLPVQPLAIPIIYPLVVQHNYGKSPILTGKSIIHVVIFHSYVSLP